MAIFVNSRGESTVTPMWVIAAVIVTWMLYVLMRGFNDISNRLAETARILEDNNKLMRELIKSVEAVAQESTLSDIESDVTTLMLHFTKPSRSTYPSLD